MISRKKTVKGAKRRPRKVRTNQGGRPVEQLSEEDRDLISLGEELIRDAKKGHAAAVREWDKMMKQLGIQGPPIGAKKLQEMFLKEGIDPNKNEFSRGIIEMREE